MEGHENQSIERPNTLCNLELNPVGDPGNDPDNPIPHNPTPHNPIPDNPIPRRVPNNLPNDNKQVLYITSGIVMIIAILCYGISSYAAMKLELEMVKLKESLTDLNKQMTDLTTKFTDKQLQLEKTLTQSLIDNATVTKLELEMVKESLIDQMTNLTTKFTDKQLQLEKTLEMVKESLIDQMTNLTTKFTDKQLQLEKTLTQSLIDNATVVTKLEMEMVKESLTDLNKQMTMIDLTMKFTDKQLQLEKTDLTNIKQILKHKLLNQYLEDKFSLEDCSIQNNGNCSYKVKYTMPYVNIPHDIPVTIHYTYGIAIRGNIIAQASAIPIQSLPAGCIYIHNISNPSNSRTRCSDRQVFIGVAITLDGKDLLSIIHHEDVYHILAKKINAAENEDEQIVIHKVPSVTNYPHLCALAIHPIHGHIFVADHNGQIHVLNSDFSYNYTFGGEKGNTKGKFVNLAFIAVDKEGYVYVTDHDRNCVLKFNSKGTFIKEFGSDRLFHNSPSPLGIAIDSYGAVYVLDIYNPPKFNTHICIFDSDGNFIHYIEYIRDGDKVMCIPATWAIAIDDNDNLIIPDNERRRFIVI
jgi:hypothetical protein